MRDGIPIEKGVVLTKDYLDSNEELFTKYLNLWILSPDLLLDVIQDSEDAKHWHLQPYQRLALRAQMRYRYHFFTACRATSKSFCAYLGGYLKCMLLPNSNVFIASDVKGTVIKTAEAKFEEFFRHWPLLENELATRQDDGKTGQKKSGNYYELNFKNGSKLTVVSKDTSRGLRATSGILEEAATISEEDYNEVLLPQLNVPRREVDGSLNPEEPVSTQTFITTARERTVFMYGKLIECAVNAVIDPSSYFVWGVSYEVPLKYGIINKQMLLDQRDSSTMSDEAFLRESQSVWTGNNADAWFDSKKLSKRRTLLKCERHSQLNPKNRDTFYVLSCDVGRYNANTAIMILKVLPGKEVFKKKVVYTEVLNGANFITQQAPRIKELIEQFSPREVVIDGNGLGAGLLDAMAIPSFDAKTGKQYPAYFAFNNDEHLPPGKKTESDEPMPELNAIIYDLKAGSTNDGPIHSNFFTQMNNGSVSLLAHEGIVKDKLLNTKKGKKMTPYDRRVFLLPYEMTSRLIDEINNLRLKPTGVQNQYKVERISRAIEKDRVSSLEYGLWRVKYYEDKALRKAKKKKLNGQYAFFSPRTRG
jgi:hypothetical protein